ncbi:hypothetical protein [Streptomyces achromogenes]|uniref:hypothetical protein n=1 Tax=Streptomyces achromogenes TaxID=67255 RepID=UPI00341897C4
MTEPDDFGRGFPHAVQVVRILRHRTDLKAGTVSRQTVYSITDLTWQQASPQRLGRLVSSQWTIESRLHFVRGTTLAEDASTIRTGHGPDRPGTISADAGAERARRAARPCAGIISPRVREQRTA